MYYSLWYYANMVYINRFVFHPIISNILKHIKLVGRKYPNMLVLVGFWASKLIIIKLPCVVCLESTEYINNAQRVGGREVGDIFATGPSRELTQPWFEAIVRASWQIKYFYGEFVFVFCFFQCHVFIRSRHHQTDVCDLKLLVLSSQVWSTHE